MLMLTACSSGSADRPKLTSVNQAPIVHPSKPRPVTLQDEKWYPCGPNGKSLCMNPAEAKKLLRNKAELGRYMTEMNNLVDYYRKQ